jgi:hypothetical protein
MVHLPRSIECLCCNETYPTYSAMIIHLESGACRSNIDIYDLNKVAARCFQWKAYIEKEYRDDLLSGCNLQDEYGEGVRPFKCPECYRPFTKLSGLFQHVYSKACNQKLNSGKVAKLVRWLERELDPTWSLSE